MSRQGVLADGEELSANPLSRHFNGLRTTQIAVDVAWRIAGLFLLGIVCRRRGRVLAELMAERLPRNVRDRA
jgi:hypothetical protein